QGVQTQRKYFRKTAKGKIVEVLRERYLRDDVACGIEGICTSHDPPLSPRDDLTHQKYPNGHYIMPDTNVFLRQMDLVESPLFTVPIILLQTVLEE
ncbi:uncharacterized protein EI90DRAFT_2825517, partial [Cantharellus anzutake]|uniref:uncharacterized protein n=1 Tax=Cantharellus anzutake TaxID=1750568 RepID=UPI001906BCE4